MQGEQELSPEAGFLFAEICISPEMQGQSLLQLCWLLKALGTRFKAGEDRVATAPLFLGYLQTLLPVYPCAHHLHMARDESISALSPPKNFLAGMGSLYHP